MIKQRLSKSYRHPQLDTSLRQFRTRREAKILEKLKSAGLPVPSIEKMDDKNMELSMQFIEGQKLRDVFEQNPEVFSKAIGTYLAKLHALDVIHGDLTTSNMILDAATQQLVFIDFGLSQFSQKIEDKAVDLHLLQQALEAKHHTVAQEAFPAVLEAYQAGYADASAVIERLKIVRERGRNKH